MLHVPSHPGSGLLNRRTALKQAACGFGQLALASLCGAASSKPHHHPARAKRVIFLFMQGGPSHVDSFDYKPELIKWHDRRVEFDVARTRKRTAEKVMKPLWDFQQHGQSGKLASDLFPHIHRHVDDLCFLQGMHTEGVAHGPATLFLHTGATNLVRPSMGAWVMYGLGQSNRNLPGFVTLNPPMTKGGPRNWSNAFLPTVCQGTAIGRAGMPPEASRIAHLTPEDPQKARGRFDLVKALNNAQWAAQPSDPLSGVMESFELAWRMQSHAPEVFDLASEPASTLERYGIGKDPTDAFGRQCLTARRLAEAGVRFIQVNYSDHSNTPRWDQHSNMPKHAEHALATDLPVSALLDDLKQRGLMDDTLVWWGGEFGRTPYSQGNDGRDHNPRGFTVWLAGGGVRPGMTYGETDEFGYQAVQNKVHMHDLHATILHLLGLDHEQLTYRHEGRDFRLTDIYGRVVHEILS